MRVTDAVAVVGGADLHVLAHARSERENFIGLGAVMLGTASVAALSMTFAIYNAVLVEIDPRTGGPAAHQPFFNLVIAIVLGLLWGALILLIDRALVKTMQGVSGVTAIWYAIPRFILAVIIGVVVSTPLTIQVFSDQIAAQVKQDQDAAVERVQQEATSGSTAQKLATVKDQIASNEDILAGRVDSASTPELTAAQSLYDSAAEALRDAETAKDEAYLVMICEKEGAGANPQCEGRASTEAGEGPLYAARLQEYNSALSTFAAAQSAASDATTKLNAARDDAVEETEQVLAAAREQAQLDLCGKAVDEDGNVIAPAEADPECASGLRAQAVVLQRTLDGLENGELARQQGGLLAQVVALGELSTATPAAGLAHLFVALLFIVIELLPVMIKTFMALRGVNQYDRIASRLRDDEYAGVTSGTEEDQRQRDREVSKREAIRDDMVSREISLGKKANAHVQKEMEAIITRALGEWSSELQASLKQSPASAGMGRSAQGQPTRNPLGLPDPSSR